MITDDNIEYLDHMTDAFVRCKGKTLEDAFQFGATGLVNIMYDIKNIEKRQKVSVSAEGFDLENLLFDWLEKILLLLLIDKIILVEFKININFNKQLNRYIIEGYGLGDLADLGKHELKVEIKGITYHEMKIFKDENKNEFFIQYIVDL
jgi:SHS2 domain-containing protein